MPSVLFRNYWTDLPEILHVEFSEANPRNLLSGFGIDLTRNANSKFSHLPYLSRKYAFSGFEKQLHKNYGTNFHHIWYNGASYHRKELRKIWHLSLQKCESRNFSFLFIPLTRTPMFRTPMYLRYFDPLVYLF